MDTERKQADLIRRYVNEASSLSGSSLTKLITDATSNPNLFAFSEILAVPSVAQLEGTEESVYVDLLPLFAFGTWSDYKGKITDAENAGSYVALVPERVLKLKQLTVLSVAAYCKDLPYDVLMPAIDFPTVRELEDFLVDSCISVGIVKGELNPLLGCLEVQDAAARDPTPDKLRNIIAFFSSWSSTVDKLLVSVQENIKLAQTLDKGKEEEDVENEPKKLQSHKRQVNQEDEQPISKRPHI